MIQNQKTAPNKSQALELKRESEQGLLTYEKVKNILNQKTKQPDLTIPANQIEKYFPTGYTKEQMKEIIIQLLDSWKATRH